MLQKCVGQRYSIYLQLICQSLITVTPLLIFIYLTELNHEWFHGCSSDFFISVLVRLVTPFLYELKKEFVLFVSLFWLGVRLNWSQAHKIYFCSNYLRENSCEHKKWQNSWNMDNIFQPFHRKNSGYSNDKDFRIILHCTWKLVFGKHVTFIFTTHFGTLTTLRLGTFVSERLNVKRFLC